MRILAAIALSVLGLAPGVQAAFVIDVAESGGNVVFTGAGTLTLTAWSCTPTGGDFGRINPGSSAVLVGPTSSVDTDQCTTPTNFAGPAAFGSVLDSNADSGSGDIAGLAGTALLRVPEAYSNGGLSPGALSSSSTYNGATIASLGMTPGTYTWTWGSGVDADSLTLNVPAASATPTPTPTATAVPTLPVYGLALTMLGLLLVAGRRLRTSAKRK